MPTLDTLTYDGLIAGSADLITEPITIGKSQTILRGDVLVKDGTTGTYLKATAVVAATDDVFIASEDITTDVNTTVVSTGYRAGEFNEYAMRFGGSTTADDNRAILADKSIYMKKVQQA